MTFPESAADRGSALALRAMFVVVAADAEPLDVEPVRSGVAVVVVCLRVDGSAAGAGATLERPSLDSARKLAARAALELVSWSLAVGAHVRSAAGALRLSLESAICAVPRLMRSVARSVAALALRLAEVPATTIRRVVTVRRRFQCAAARAALLGYNVHVPPRPRLEPRPRALDTSRGFSMRSCST